MKTTLIGCIVLVCVAVRAGAAEIPVFVIAGQSNAVGNGSDVTKLSSNLLKTQPNVLYSGQPLMSVNPLTPAPIRWALLKPPTQLEHIYAKQGFGPELTVGKTISDALGGGQVGEIKFAVSGSDLHRNWNPEKPGSYYHLMLKRVNDGLAALPTQQVGTTGRVAGFFWMQGESDAANRTKEQYQADLTNLISHVRADFHDVNLPFVFGSVNHCGTPVQIQAIRQAQTNVAKLIPRTFLFDTDHCERCEPKSMGGLIHFNSQGLVNLGIGFGKGYLSIVSQTPDPHPSQPQGH
jgi:hypothetical protein